MELTLWTYEVLHVVRSALRVDARRSPDLHSPQGDYADLLFMIEREGRRPPVTYTRFKLVI